MNFRDAATIATVLAVAGCTDWKRSVSATAPDGKTVAQVEVALAGASSSNQTRVVIKNGNGGSLPKPVYVLQAEGAIVDRTTLRWMDPNHLRVTICEATGYRVETLSLREPPFIDAGRGDGMGIENAVWVDVINLDYSDEAKRCVPRERTP